MTRVHTKCVVAGGGTSERAFEEYRRYVRWHAGWRVAESVHIIILIERATIKFPGVYVSRYQRVTQL